MVKLLLVKVHWMKRQCFIQGEKLGNKNGPYFDIAVDPLEGTNFAANNLPGATSVIAIAEKGNLFNAPETYMDKIATGPIEKGFN